MQVFISDEQTECSVDCKILESQIRSILMVLECEDREISVLLTDDRKMRNLNKRYRDKNLTTDVLSFPQNEGGEEGLNPHLLGDVVISTTTAKRQSTEHGLSLEEEIVLLLIHGILHLLGFDHERSDEEAHHMKEKTQELFGRIFPNKKPAESCNF